MRYGRRLVLVVAWLALVDQFVPSWLRTIEHARYEGNDVYRFENSDLFPLGPLVAYLRDHPERPRPRILFFGNSVMFGFGLPARAALPAHFQDLHPEARALNAAVNGFSLGSAYLIAKAAIASIDRIYVQLVGTTATPLLPSLIPVDDEDVRAFQLDPPSRLEERLQELAGVWRLYGASYRVQAAAFGTSTRQYVYLHKGDIVRRLLGRGTDPAPEPPPDRVEAPVDVVAPRSDAPPSEPRRAELRETYPVLWQFEELIQRHRKRAVFLLLGEADYLALSGSDIADFNAAFGPYGEIVHVRFPSGPMTYDGLHLTDGGARRVAEALIRHEQDVVARPQ
jgi:hypothetical protein